MNTNPPRMIYWDSSAILSALLQDKYSEQAVRCANFDLVHLISTLALAETHAVVNRLKRERTLADIQAKAALEVLEQGPWRLMKINPDALQINKMAAKWPLRGADLWHLATAKSLKLEFPELAMLTFDQRLYSAASGENLAMEIHAT